MLMQLIPNVKPREVILHTDYPMLAEAKTIEPIYSEIIIQLPEAKPRDASIQRLLFNKG